MFLFEQRITRDEEEKLTIHLYPLLKQNDLASDDLQQQGLDDSRLVSNGVPSSIHFGVNGQRIFEDRLHFTTVN